MTSKSRTLYIQHGMTMFNVEQENTESNCSSNSLSALNLSYSSSSLYLSGGGIDTPKAHETAKELGEDNVKPYLDEPEFTGSLLDWQCWQLSSATASTEVHCYSAR